MATNKGDTLITISTESRDKLRTIANAEQRTMKVVLERLIADALKNKKVG
jgi:phosphoheptose isomerase